MQNRQAENWLSVGRSFGKSRSTNRAHSADLDKIEQELFQFCSILCFFFVLVKENRKAECIIFSRFPKDVTFLDKKARGTSKKHMLQRKTKQCS